MQQDPPSPAQPLRIDPQAIHVDAIKILQRLTGHGYDAYLVGGCVRDLLLNRRPKDFDIATSARPRQIKRLFRNSRIIGRRFRLVHIRFGPRILEVSTFRAPPEPQGDEDDPYIRRDNVFGTREQDAKRRDFTINGLFYDIAKRKVIDHVDGVSDLESRQMRTIGEAELRVREDPVRILRAARFAGRLGFTLTPDLKDAARNHAADLAKSAPPRILEEIFRLVGGEGAAEAWRLLDELGAVEVLLPEIAPLPEFFFAAIERLEQDFDGQRVDVPQSFMLAVLLWPYVRTTLEEADSADYEALLSDMLRPIGLRLTISRRDLTVARQTLAAQAHLAQEPHGRGARRFARRDFFAEAVQLRRVLGPLVKQDPDPLPLWEALAAAPPPKKKGRRRRRSRRGGRKRSLRGKSGGGKDESCPDPSASSSAPARPAP